MTRRTTFWTTSTTTSCLSFPLFHQCPCFASTSPKSTTNPGASPDLHPVNGGGEETLEGGSGQPRPSEEVSQLVYCSEAGVCRRKKGFPSSAGSAAQAFLRPRTFDFTQLVVGEGKRKEGAHASCWGPA